MNVQAIIIEIETSLFIGKYTYYTEILKLEANIVHLKNICIADLTNFYYE